MAVRTYQDLLAWQRAMDMVVGVYTLTQRFPREEIYGLTSQIRRAAVSVASNIAEGQGRNSVGEFKQFLGVARGSNLEVQTHLVIAGRLAYGTDKDVVECEHLSVEVNKMLNGLM